MVMPENKRKLKSAINAPRGDYFKLLPSDLTRVLDAAHPLYQERVHQPPNEALARRFDRRAQDTGQLVIPGTLVGWVDPDTKLTLILDGRQRHSALALANTWRKKRGDEPLRCGVLLHKTADMAELALLASELNENRLTDNPVMRAEAMQRHLNDLLSVRDDDGAVIRTETDEERIEEAQRDVADAFGLSLDGLRFNLKINGLTDKLKTVVAEGRLGPTEAVREFAAMEPAEQEKKLAATPLKEPGKKRRTKKDKDKSNAAHNKLRRPAPKFCADVATETSGLSDAVREALLWGAGVLPTAKLTGRLKDAVLALEKVKAERTSGKGEKAAASA